MGFGWKEIVPSDIYCVRAIRTVSSTELAYITHLYQPLIGSLSASLYITLVHELAVDRTAYGNHRWLMSVMGTSLDKIVEAREFLEAMGLLCTSKIRVEDGNNIFEYELHPPLQPTAFFGDDMLSMILLNRVGKTKYQYLRMKFVGKVQPLEGERTELTKSFDEVFHSITPSEIMVTSGSETEQFLTEMDERYPAGELSAYPEIASAIQLKKSEHDFAFLEAALPKSYGNRTLNAEMRAAIKELAFFYQLDDMQISYFLQDPYSYNDSNELDASLLRQRIRDWYHRQNNGQGPDAVIRPKEEAKVTEETETGPKRTKEEEHKAALEKLSPIALLEQYQDGGKNSPADLKIIEELLHNYKLPPAVINVLLEYVMITNNKQLPRSLIFKIATHWKRLGIETVDQALTQAKQLYQENKAKTRGPKESTKNPSTYRKPATPQKSDLPEWVVRQIEQPAKETVDEVVDEVQKQEIAELLKALGEID
ncbi:replication initiation and membrane attachment family protein [Ammoniphilus resinae]|uniref:Replication initiation and membrane attachment protein n=1 Tax=Ammoniphilus resinae TaxID=861532 RepID=A0ABS4GJ80_9BACL|nr:DnaD domain protein [Ammoniphilus resinae]MBP1930317.1 replication initiation and membrane attachment protein [Ammoniphilus resinae]